MLLGDAQFNSIAGREDWGRAVCNRREPEAAGDLGGEGEEEGGEVPGAILNIFGQRGKKRKKMKKEERYFVAIFKNFKKTREEREKVA